MKSIFKFSPQAWGELEGGVILFDLRQPPPNLPQAWGRNNSILQEAQYSSALQSKFVPSTSILIKDHPRPSIILIL